MSKIINIDSKKPSGEELPFTFANLVHRSEMFDDDSTDSFEDAGDKMYPVYTYTVRWHRVFLLMAVVGCFMAILYFGVMLITTAQDKIRPVGMPTDMCYIDGLPHIRDLKRSSMTYVNIEGDLVYAELRYGELIPLTIVQADLCH